MTSEVQRAIHFDQRICAGNEIYFWRDKEWERGVVVDTGDIDANDNGTSRRYVDVRLKVRDVAQNAEHYHIANTGDGEVFDTVRVNEAECYLVNTSENHSDSDVGGIKSSNSFEGSIGHEQSPVQAPEDLIHLDFLHEPGILDALRVRYKNGDIYTSSGKVLIAVNPYVDLDIYTKDMMRLYSNDSPQSKPPHVYSIAEQAYREMMSCKLPQSILISGESGAGKTETAKKVMQFLAFRQQHHHHYGHANGAHSTEKKKASAKISIEHAVLESNPLLEAFGNAKTSRNENSSRFGKYVRLWFDNVSGTLENASITTYLLERSRVVEVAEGERSYHIFYQLLKGASTSMREKLFLSNNNSTEYKTPSFKLFEDPQQFSDSNIDDIQGFKLTLQAMAIIGLSEIQIEEILKLISAILHIQEICFISSNKSGEDCAVIDNADSKCLFHIHAVSSLLCVDREAVVQSLTTKVIVVGKNERYVTKLSCSAAEDSRNSLAKELYGQLFQWLVQAINFSISGRLENESERPLNSYSDNDANAGVMENRTSISILDIYGFEAFESNSFEQLCINLANEKLQQQFNSEVLKGEQEVYIEEGIEWSYVDYVDNQHVLDVIEGSKSPYCPGVLPVLDEYCRIPKATAISFTSALKKGMSEKKGFFECKSKLRQDLSFGIEHFAGKVIYDSTLMLQKNREYTVEEHKILLLSSQSSFLQDVMKVGTDISRSNDNIDHLQADTAKSESHSSTLEAHKSKFLLSTVGRSFCDQLKILMYDLRCTHPHYIRCIKPNRESVPDHFDASYITDQLRCSGVMETIRVACAGYPCRRSFDQIIARYSILCSRHAGKRDPVSHQLSKHQNTVINEVEHVRSILEAANINGYKMGKTKVFLRYDDANRLEVKKHQIFADSATKIQATAKQFIARRRFRQLRDVAIKLQSYVRRKRSIRELSKRKLEQAQRELATIEPGYVNSPSVDNVSKTEIKKAINTDFDTNGHHRAHLNNNNKDIASNLCGNSLFDTDAPDNLDDLDIESSNIENLIRMLYERILRYQAALNKRRVECGKREVSLHKKKSLFENSLQFDPDTEADDEGFFFMDLWKVQLQDQIKQSQKIIEELKHESKLKSELLSMYQKRSEILEQKSNTNLSTITSQKELIEQLQRTILSEREMFRERKVQETTQKVTEDVNSLRKCISVWRLKNGIESESDAFSKQDKDSACDPTDLNDEQSSAMKRRMSREPENVVSPDGSHIEETIIPRLPKVFRKHTHIPRAALATQTQGISSPISPKSENKDSETLINPSVRESIKGIALTDDDSTKNVLLRVGWNAIAEIIERKSVFLHEDRLEKEESLLELSGDLRLEIDALCDNFRNDDFVKQVRFVSKGDPDYRLLVDAGWKSSPSDDSPICIPLVSMLVYRMCIVLLNLRCRHQVVYSVITRIFDSLKRQALFAVERSSKKQYDSVIAWLSVATNLRSLTRNDLLSHVDLNSASRPISLILLKLIVDVRNWHLEMASAVEGFIYNDFSDLVGKCCSDLMLNAGTSESEVDVDRREILNQKVVPRFSDSNFDQQDLQQVDLVALSQHDDTVKFSPRTRQKTSSAPNSPKNFAASSYQNNSRRSASHVPQRPEIEFAVIVGELSSLLKSFKRFAIIPSRSEDDSYFNGHFSHVILVRLLIQAALSSIDAEFFNTILMRRECCNTYFARLLESLVDDIECWFRSTKSLSYTTPRNERDGGALLDPGFVLKHIKQLTSFILQKKRYLLHKFSRDEREEVITTFVKEACPALTLPQLYRVTAMHTGDTDGYEDDMQEAAVSLLNTLRALAASETYNFNGSSPSPLKANGRGVVLSPKYSIMTSILGDDDDNNNANSILGTRLSLMGDDGDLNVLERVLDTL